MGLRRLSLQLDEQTGRCLSQLEGGTGLTPAELVPVALRALWRELLDDPELFAGVRQDVLTDAKGSKSTAGGRGSVLPGQRRPAPGT